MKPVLQLLLLFCSIYYSTKPLFAQEEEEKDPLCDYYADKDISASKKAVKLYFAGKALYKKKLIKDAKDKLLQAIELDENFAHPKMLLGDIHYFARVKNYKAARARYLEVIELCPDFHENIYKRITKAELSMRFIEDPLQVYKNCVQYTEKYLELASPKKMAYEKMSKQCTDCKNFVAVYSNPVPFNPMEIKGLKNLGTDEYMPIISPDNEIMYFNKRYQEAGKGLGRGSKPKWVEYFFYAKKTSEGFSDEDKMPLPFNNGRNQGGPTFSINNKEMYISICDDPNNVGETLCDLYYSQKVDTGWTDFVNLNEMSDYKINGCSWEAQPSISPDGKTLYYSSDIKHEAIIKGWVEGSPLITNEQLARVESDIYKIEKQENGKWGKPIALGPNINTDKKEQSPFIHQDNQTLYFASQGHLNIGPDDTKDIFISRKQKDLTWGPALNIGVPINTPADEADFFVSTDGVKGFYSARIDGDKMWDIYEFELYERAKPKELIMRKGQVVDDNGEVIKNAKIKLRNNETNEEIDVDVNAETGEYVFIETVDKELEDVSDDQTNLYADQFKSDETKDAFDYNLNKKGQDSLTQAFDSSIQNDSVKSAAEPEKKAEFDYNLTVQKEGHFFNSTNINSDDPNALKVQTNDFKLSKIEKGASFRMDNLLFATDSYELTKRSQNELLALADFMRLNKGIKIGIHGHTDNAGSYSKNITLSKNRAHAVYQFLIEKGIPENRLSFKGYGSKVPVASNKTEEGREQNRRTEVVIL